jgi:hypothetical protein
MAARAVVDSARDRRGRPVAGSFESRINWRIFEAGVRPRP